MERYSREADSVKESIALLETQNNAKIEPITTTRCLILGKVDILGDETVAIN